MGVFAIAIYSHGSFLQVYGVQIIAKNEIIIMKSSAKLVLIVTNAIKKKEYDQFNGYGRLSGLHTGFIQSALTEYIFIRHICS